jgi:hypothetical protein
MTLGGGQNVDFSLTQARNSALTGIASESPLDAVKRANEESVSENEWGNRPLKFLGGTKGSLAATAIFLLIEQDRTGINRTS